MENSPPYYKEGLPLPTTISNTEKQRSRSSSRSSIPSIFFALFSCVAWLYIAGRLWQDAENKMLLSNLLMKNSAEYDAFDIGLITTDDFTNADILEATYPAVAKRLHGDWIEDPAIPIVTGSLERVGELVL